MFLSFKQSLGGETPGSEKGLLEGGSSCRLKSPNLDKGRDKTPDVAVQSKRRQANGRKERNEDRRELSIQSQDADPKFQSSPPNGKGLLEKKKGRRKESLKDMGGQAWS